MAWIFVEAPGLAARTGIASRALDGPLRTEGSIYIVGARLHDHNRHVDRVLALADPYLHWLAPAHDDHDDFRWAQDMFAGQ